MFSNRNVGCSLPDVAEFYANCQVAEGLVTSLVGGIDICFGIEELGDALGVPSSGFGYYLRDDKSVLGPDRLLEITRRLSNQHSLTVPRAVHKGELSPLHRLCYWFLIKNIIPRGQGRDMVDALDLCLTDLLAQGELINLPALMIHHIRWIANISKPHAMGYGFLLTSVLEQAGVSLKKKVMAGLNDDIGKATIQSYGFELIKQPQDEEQVLQTPVVGVPGTGCQEKSLSSLEHLVLQEDLAVVKITLQ